MQLLWTGAAAALALAVASGIADHRRARRRDFDRVGWVPWSFVQMMALIAALICASLALHWR